MSEIRSICGICLRLLSSLPPDGAEARWLMRWMQAEPGLFGPLPAERGAQLQVLAERTATLPHTPADDLRRLGAIALHCGLDPEQSAILDHLALRHRKGAMDLFCYALSRGIGLSPEAIIGWCCNLAEEQVWSMLAPSGRLIREGFIISDATAPFQQDEAYALSGLLVSLIAPPYLVPKIGGISPLTRASEHGQDAWES